MVTITKYVLLTLVEKKMRHQPMVDDADIGEVV
jgi:hypothetical protein